LPGADGKVLSIALSGMMPVPEGSVGHVDHFRVGILGAVFLFQQIPRSVEAFGGEPMMESLPVEVCHQAGTK
jgi:hypothetical protein